MTIVLSSLSRESSMKDLPIIARQARMALGEFFLEIAIRLCAPGWSASTWHALGEFLKEMRKDFNAETPENDGPPFATAQSLSTDSRRTSSR